MPGASLSQELDIFAKSGSFFIPLTKSPVSHLRQVFWVQEGYHVWIGGDTTRSNLEIKIDLGRFKDVVTHPRLADWIINFEIISPRI